MEVGLRKARKNKKLKNKRMEELKNLQDDPKPTKPDFYMDFADDNKSTTSTVTFFVDSELEKDYLFYKS